MTNNITNTGFIFKGNTTQVLKQVWKAIEASGKSYKSQRGIVKSIKGVTLVIEDPLNDSKNYPYWDKKSDYWYQDNFVRLETNSPPEILPIVIPSVVEGSLKKGKGISRHARNDKNIIYPYKYVWRSRFYDLGYGNLMGVINVLKKLGIKSLQVKTEDELKTLLTKTYKFYHPETILAVLNWKGLRLINYYLKNPEVLHQELTSNRKDTLLSIIDELKHSPSSRRAIIPSFTYPNIDQSGAAGGVPVYQNYQLYMEFDKNGKPLGLVSFHLHRAFDAYGGMQLDINHDKDWGKLASKKLGLPLLKMVIYGNDVWASDEKTSPKTLKEKTDIRSWLLFVTDAYNPSLEDFKKRLEGEHYKSKLSFTLDKLKNYTV